MQIIIETLIPNNHFHRTTLPHITYYLQEKLFTMATTKKTEDLSPKFTIRGCAKVLTLISDFTHNPDTYGIEHLRREKYHIEANFPLA
ncbi:hypothetical protein CMUS01_13518 [Colletotrichum musicola]|uniref:Uncharacterized protein n=1 Tax=Colletotrichum musicola TaxID=2175873 RepID=A0A8H6JCR3_9PEZI|nr:hypothetical protein CMUS01_13518 [Colletotrichum musicola]